MELKTNFQKTIFTLQYDKIQSLASTIREEARRKTRQAQGVLLEVFEFVLIILTCVVASSVLDEFSRISIPVLQVIIGLIVALILPGVQEMRIDSELFLVLFMLTVSFSPTKRSPSWMVLSMDPVGTSYTSATNV